MPPSLPFGAKKSASEGPIALETPHIVQYKPVLVNRDYRKTLDFIGKNEEGIVLADNGRANDAFRCDCGCSCEHECRDHFLVVHLDLLFFSALLGGFCTSPSCAVALVCVERLYNSP